MEKYSFNQDWLVTNGVANPFGADPLAHAKKVTLPYDAMIYEEPSETEPNGTASGFTLPRLTLLRNPLLQMQAGKTSKFVWSLKGSWPKPRFTSMMSWWGYQ